MEIIEIQQRIHEKINQLEKGRPEIIKRARKRAETISEYEKELSLAIVKLKNGMITELHGLKIDNLPATLIEKVAKGVVYKEKLNMELADAEYKAAITGMQSLEAELNGYQSMNRYLKHEN
jgi:hypothetical protein